MMKLYDYERAPNPRRVKIFLAEKGVEVELVNCDMTKGEHKTPEFLKKNPSGKIPVLELDDGRCLGESVAICRYIEGVHPEPNLMGRDPFEIGHIEMRNGPIVGAMGIFKQIPEAKVASDANVAKYSERLDAELAATPYVAGERFTIADITLLTAIDFATSLVGLTIDESNSNLWRWHAQVSARDSVNA